MTENEKQILEQNETDGQHSEQQGGGAESKPQNTAEKRALGKLALLLEAEKELRRQSESEDGNQM